MTQKQAASVADGHMASNLLVPSPYLVSSTMAELRWGYHGGVPTDKTHPLSQNPHVTDAPRSSATEYRDTNLFPFHKARSQSVGIGTMSALTPRMPEA